MIEIKTYIFKRKLGQGQRSYRVRWKDPKSKSWKAISGGRTENEAKIIEAEIRQKLLRGEDPGSSEPVQTEWTVGQVVELFYLHSRFLSGTKEWKKQNIQRINNDVLPQLGDAKFADLNSDRIFKFYLSLKSRGLTHSTIEKYNNLLRIMGDIYAEQSLDFVNPVRRIRDFTKRFPKQAPSRDINFLTPSELKALFEETKRSPAQLLYQFTRFLAFTGLRRSELLNLKWTDVDESAMLLHVRKSKSGRSRTLPLDPEALLAIKDLKGRGSFVFTKMDGDRYYPDSFLRPLQRAAKRAKINKRIDIHTLRHSYGSNKIRMGWGLKKVSVLLGHADISTTAKIYTHLLDGDLKIRDDARLDFDNQADSKDILTQGEDTKVAQMIANIITEKLGSSSEGQVALGDFMRALSAATSFFKQQDSSTSVEKTGDFQESSENSSYAPLMLHEQGDGASNNPNAGGSNAELSVSLQGLVTELSGVNGMDLEAQADFLRKRCSTN